MAFAAFLTSCGHATAPPRRIAQAIVPVVAAHPGTVTPRSTLGGLIAPFQNVQVTTTVVEPTDAVYVSEGDRVSKGQVLAQLDTADLQAQLESALGTIASDEAKTKQTYLQSDLTISQNAESINAAQASVRQAQQTLANDSLTLTRDEHLLAQGYVAQATVDQQRTVVANDQQAVRSAQVNLANIQSQVQTNGSTSSGLQGATIESVRAQEETAKGAADQLRVQIAKARIVSPIDGVVINRNLNPGEFPGSRQIFTIQESDKVYAVLNGSGTQIVGVPLGSTVKVASTDSAALQAYGKVTAVLDQLTPGSTNFVVKAVVPNPSGRFHSGMVVTGEVSRRASSGIAIPRTAFTDDTQSAVQTIVPAPRGQGYYGGTSGRPSAPSDASANAGANGRGNGAGRGPNAGGPGGIIKTIPVTLVAEDDKNAIVQGLQQGETVVSNGQLGLVDGQPASPQSGNGRRGPRNVAER